MLDSINSYRSVLVVECSNNQNLSQMVDTRTLSMNDLVVRACTRILGKSGLRAVKLWVVKDRQMNPYRALSPEVLAEYCARAQEVCRIDRHKKMTIIRQVSNS